MVRQSLAVLQRRDMPRQRRRLLAAAKMLWELGFSQLVLHGHASGWVYAISQYETFVIR